MSSTFDDLFGTDPAAPAKRKPSTTIAEVTSPLLGMPVFMAGSLVAADEYNLDLAFDDADLFCPSGEVLIAATQKLLSEGFTMNDKFTKVWRRWMKYGFMNWHTNSIKVNAPSGAEVNLIFKKTGKQPLTSLSMVLESFDFGLLGVGYDLEEGLKRQDMRTYLFPDHDIKGPLPLMPNKRSAWRAGMFSQYNGTRECGRYAKYISYGHDLSLVRDDLLEGYKAAASYYYSTEYADKSALADIYMRIRELIEDNDIDQLLEAAPVIASVEKDAFDAIMEALE